jgi:hypothetical protein
MSGSLRTITDAQLVEELKAIRAHGLSPLPPATWAWTGAR